MGVPVELLLSLPVTEVTGYLSAVLQEKLLGWVTPSGVGFTVEAPGSP